MGTGFHGNISVPLRPICAEPSEFRLIMTFIKPLLQRNATEVSIKAQQSRVV